jgi:hypothetical protein
MISFAGELRGRAQVRDGSVIFVQVDHARGRQRGQPAACYQQAPVLGERGAGRSRTLSPTSLASARRASSSAAIS